MSEEQLTQAEGERLEQRTREAASRIELERQLYRERGATVMEVVENSAIHANNAVSKAENHMISPVLKALVNRGLG